LEVETRDNVRRGRRGSEPRFAFKAKPRPSIDTDRYCKADLMHKFSWRTMLIFVASLFLAVIPIGLGTAHISKLKQQRRELSKTSLFMRHPDATTDLHVKHLASRNPASFAPL
jgi:hypothetical protein